MDNVPSAYVAGYAKALAIDQEAADNYIRHTRIGDPVFDPIMEELSSVPPADLHRFIKAGIEQQEEGLRKAPQILRDFIESLEDRPRWLDYDAFRPGIRAFHANVDLMLIAFVTGVLVEGFSTLIAKSFSITERVSSTTRRLQQNNRHMMDIFFPGGLYRENDGWKLSTPHSLHSCPNQVLAEQFGGLESRSLGHAGERGPSGFCPLCLFQAFAGIFAAGWVHVSAKKKERVFWLSGATPVISWEYLKRSSIPPQPKRKKYTRSATCAKPLPDSASITVANGLIQAIPSVAGVREPAEVKKLTELAYRLSRALIGNQLASRFEFPKSSTIGTLFYFRMKQRLQRILRGRQSVRSDNFTQLLQISVFDEHGLSYKMPDHVKHSKSSPW